MAMNYTSSGPIGGVAFLVHSAPVQDPGPSTGVTVTWPTEIFDVGTNFASNIFTAPITGKYMFNWITSVQSPDSSSDHIRFDLITSNRTFIYACILDPVFVGSCNYFPLNGSICADMDASDTAYLTFNWSSGTGASDIRDQRFFSGHLVA